MLHYNFEDLGRENLMKGNYRAIATKNGLSQSGDTSITLPTNISLNDLQGRKVIFSYDYSVEGTKLKNTGNWNEDRYGLHGTVYYKQTSSSSATVNYPFASYLEASGTGKAVQSYTFPTGVDSITSFSIGAQPYNRPASDNNNTWYIKNLKLELLENTNESETNFADKTDIVYDISGFEHNGAITNCKVVTDTNSYIGKRALDTTTNNGYITLPEFYLDISFSICMWAKHISPFATWARLFDFGTATAGTGYSFGCAVSNTAGDLYVFGRVGGTSAALPDTKVETTDFNWHLYAVTVNGTTISYYRDGSLIKSFTANGNIGGRNFTLNYIGKSNWSSDGFSRKYISDFRIYNTCLSANDVYNLYTSRAEIDKLYKLSATNFQEDNRNTYGILTTENPLSPHSNSVFKTKQIREDARELLPPPIKSSERGYYTRNGTDYLSISGENLVLRDHIWVATPIIEVDPTYDNYTYDFTYTNSTNGNLVYIGFERFDANFTSESNEACWYFVSDSAVYTNRNLAGTIPLRTTDRYIRLRVLNNWNSISGAPVLTISKYSVKANSKLTGVNTYDSGILTASEFIEK